MILRNFKIENLHSLPTRLCIISDIPKITIIHCTFSLMSLLPLLLLPIIDSILCIFSLFTNSISLQISIHTNPKLLHCSTNVNRRLRFTTHYYLLTTSSESSTESAPRIWSSDPGRLVPLTTTSAQILSLYVAIPNQILLSLSLTCLLKT